MLSWQTRSSNFFDCVRGKFWLKLADLFFQGALPNSLILCTSSKNFSSRAHTHSSKHCTVGNTNDISGVRVLKKCSAWQTQVYFFVPVSTNHLSLLSSYPDRVFQPSTQRSRCRTFKSLDTMHFRLTHRMGTFFVPCNFSFGFTCSHHKLFILLLCSFFYFMQFFIYFYAGDWFVIG